MQSRRALVIAIGNPLREDDGAGPAVAARLVERGVLREGDTDIVCVHQLLPELAERIAAARVVIFVDARVPDGGDAIVSSTADAIAAANVDAIANADADSIANLIRVERLAPDEHLLTLAGPTTHHLPPSALLGLARVLYGAAPPAAAVSVIGRSFDPVERLGDEVARAIDPMCERIEALLSDSGGR